MDAITKATNYLKFKPRTRAQVIKYLADKGYETSEIESAVALLEEYKYIDDDAFCRLFFEIGFEKGHGISRICHELEMKGVSHPIIEGTINYLKNTNSVPDQFETALEIGKKMASEFGISDSKGNVLDYEEKTKFRAKICRRLATRGYSGDISYRVSKEVIK